MSFIKDLVSKISCHHSWEEVKLIRSFIDSNDKIPARIDIIYICKKCGKFKKIKIT